MEYCSWCSKDILEVKNRDDLCGLCDRRYWEKKNFYPVHPECIYLHKDDPSDNEYRALVHMNTCQFAQEVMHERISRIKTIIQAHWTSEQEQRRAVTKAEVTYNFHSYDSLQSWKSL